MATITNNSYKARFCNQYFPDLCSFVKKFDISLKDNERNSISNLKYYNNDLGMNFLLASYDKHDYKNLVGEELKNAERTIRARKTNTYWELKEVTNADLMQAVDEYFEITSTGKKLKEQQDVLMQNLLDPLKERFTYISPEDITLRAILLTVGVLPKDKKTEIGSQIEELKKFISCAKGDEFAYKDEGRFVNALNLYKELRNLQAHELVKYDGLRKMIFHKFIAFTYIGTIYLCRRLWRDYESSLCESSYTKPQKFKSRETIDVIIETKGNQKITSCLYNYGDDIISPHIELPNKNVSFPMEVRRYEEVQIKVVCDGTKEDVIKRTFKYDYWNSAIFILIPDANTDYHVVDVAGEGHEDIDSCMSRIVNQLSSQVAEEVRDIVLETLGNFTPKFEEIKATGNHELSQEVKENLEFLSLQLDGLTNEQQNGFNTINKKIEELNNSLKDSYNKQLLESIGRIDVKTDQILENQEKEKLNRINKYSLIPLAIAIAIAVNAYLCKFDFNIKWLHYQLWGWIVGIGLPFFSFVCGIMALKNKAKAASYFSKYCSWGFFALTVIFLIGAYYLLPYKSIDSFTSNFEFDNNENESSNPNVVAFILDYLKSHPDNDDLRVKLAEYYLDNDNDDEARKQEESLKNDKNPSVAYLKGRMYIYGINDYNYQKGKDLLDSAFKNGEKRAAYWLGRSFSDMNFIKYKEKDSDSTQYFLPEYNLIKAIHYFRKVSDMPKSAFELGKIFEDLNMNDSALFYFQKAIRKSKSNYLEAKFHLGNILKKRNQENPFYDELVYNYPPAQLQYVLRKEKDHKKSITFYKKHGEVSKYKDYNGEYRYLPPIVFEYLDSDIEGKLDSALLVLKEKRKDCRFNLDFVKGLEIVSSHHNYSNAGRLAVKKRNATPEETEIFQKEKNNGFIIHSKDTAYESSWIDYMRKSAYPKQGEGCLYAEMVCLFYDLFKMDENNEKFLNLSPVMKNDIIMKHKAINERFKEIKKIIPYADVINAMRNRNLEGRVNNLSSIIDALKALNKGHLAGTVVLDQITESYANMLENDIKKFIAADIYNMSIYGEAGIKTTWTQTDLDTLRIESYANMVSLRYGAKENLEWLLYEGCTLDHIISNVDSTLYKEPYYDSERFMFWSDLVIANKVINMEALLLSTITNRYYNLQSNYKGGFTNDPYSKKLIEALIRDINDKIISESEYKVKKEYEVMLMSALSLMGNDYRSKLNRKIKGNAFGEKIIKKSEEIVNPFEFRKYTYSEIPMKYSKILMDELLLGELVYMTEGRKNIFYEK